MYQPDDLAKAAASGHLLHRAPPPQKLFSYRPEPDITVYELACLLPFLLGAPLTPAAVANLGPAARHFAEVEAPKVVPAPPGFTVHRP
jgi:hypothetical protein